jgi:hypothetical protein
MKGAPKISLSYFAPIFFLILKKVIRQSYINPIFCGTNTFINIYNYL